MLRDFIATPPWLVFSASLFPVLTVVNDPDFLALRGAWWAIGAAMFGPLLAWMALNWVASQPNDDETNWGD